MAKRKLTKQQTSRIRQQQEKLRQQTRDETSTADTQHGLLISQYGKTSLVETPQQEIITCINRPNLPSLVCGDHVVWQPGEKPDEGIIVAVNKRQSELARPDSQGRKRVIAANIDQILVVTAAKPELNEGLLDRYLVAAELTGITPVIIFNKTDLLSETDFTTYQQRLCTYDDIGYQVIFASCKQQHGLDELHDCLRSKTSIFVGQSGVGKSSLVNSLLPGANADTGEVSDATGKGQHTTTTARLYHLPGNDGNLIDSPGIREFGLWQIEKTQLTNGFREFIDYAGQCKFRNCLHVNEPGCAVQQAVKDEKISASRLDSYQRILESLEE